MEQTSAPTYSRYFSLGLLITVIVVISVVIIIGIALYFTFFAIRIIPNDSSVQDLEFEPVPHPPPFAPPGALPSQTTESGT